MDYLNDYLRVIPASDAAAIRQAIQENELSYGLADVSEQEFERLIRQIAEQDTLLTTLPELGEKLEVAPLNHYFGNLSIDLNRLFSEQAAIETASMNYGQIYKANLEDIQRAVEGLEQTVTRLEKESRGEKGLLVRSYGFEPERAQQMTEQHHPDTAYLFTDRDGSALEPAEVNRIYHTYSLTLKKEEEVNAILGDSGETTARLEVLYETPGTLTNTNPAYEPTKAIDGNDESFWFNLNLKSNNGQDKISISPEGRP